MLNKDEINARLKKSLQGKTPKLKCLISGAERITSIDYLKTKEEKFGSIDNFIKNYISSSAIKLYKQGKSVEEIKLELNPNGNHNIDINNISEAIKYYEI